jgi:hypothetical protein
LDQTQGIAVSERTKRAFCTPYDVRPYRPLYPYPKGAPAQQEAACQDLATFKKAAAGARVLLSQDEVHFAMVPTLRSTLGVKGQRPVVGQLDGHDVRSVCGARHLVTRRLTTRLVERPRPPTRSTQRYWPEAFAHHWRDIARISPAAHYPRVVIVIVKASWHQGAFITAGRAAFSPVALYPLPH